jgi:hypothetical protein
MINNFTDFTLKEKFKLKLSKIFNFCEIKGDNILCSDILTKSGTPLVRIDSKEKTKALKIKIQEKTLTIQSILNSTSERGLITKIIEIIDSLIDSEWTIYIDKDVSSGFWDYIKVKYSHLNWKDL